MNGQGGEHQQAGDWQGWSQLAQLAQWSPDQLADPQSDPEATLANQMTSTRWRHVETPPWVDGYGLPGPQTMDTAYRYPALPVSAPAQLGPPQLLPQRYGPTQPIAICGAGPLELYTSLPGPSATTLAGIHAPMRSLTATCKATAPRPHPSEPPRKLEARPERDQHGEPLKRATLATDLTQEQKRSLEAYRGMTALQRAGLASRRGLQIGGRCLMKDREATASCDRCLEKGPECDGAFRCCSWCLLTGNHCTWRNELKLRREHKARAARDSSARSRKGRPPVQLDRLDTRDQRFRPQTYSSWMS